MRENVILLSVGGGEKKKKERMHNQAARWRPLVFAR